MRGAAAGSLVHRRELGLVQARLRELGLHLELLRVLHDRAHHLLRALALQIERLLRSALCEAAGVSPGGPAGAGRGGRGPGPGRRPGGRWGAGGRNAAGRGAAGKGRRRGGRPRPRRAGRRSEGAGRGGPSPPPNSTATRAGLPPSASTCSTLHRGLDARALGPRHRARTSRAGRAPGPSGSNSTATRFSCCRSMPPPPNPPPRRPPAPPRPAPPGRLRPRAGGPGRAGGRGEGGGERGGRGEGSEEGGEGGRRGGKGEEGG